MSLPTTQAAGKKRKRSPATSAAQQHQSTFHLPPPLDYPPSDYSAPEVRGRGRGRGRGTRGRGFPRGSDSSRGGASGFRGDQGARGGRGGRRGRGRGRGYYPRSPPPPTVTMIKVS